MASSLGSLVVRLGLDASDYTSALTKAEQQASKFADTSEQTFRRASREADKFGNSLSYLKQATASIAGALGVREIVKLNDEFQNTSARLRIVTADSEDLARVQTKLFNIAQETRTSFGATSNLFYRLSTASVDLGTSQTQLLTLTEKLNKALLISGATGSTAKGALEQLSQALGANQLRGQEFNTVNEQGNRIIRALADGLGKTVGELREMANNGEITTDVFIRGFLKGAAKLDEEFAKIPVTISGAFTIAENELQKFVGTTAQSSGATTLLASTIITVAKNIDILAAAALGFGAAKLANIILTNVAAAEANVTAIIKNTTAQIANNAVIVETAKAELARLAATEAAILKAREQAIAELALANALVARGAADKAFTQVAINNLAQLGAAQAGVTAAMVTAQKNLAAAQTGTAAASGLVSRAIGFLGGPIGAVTTVLGLGVTAWQLYGSISEQNANKASQATEQSTQSIIANLDKQLERLRLRNRLAAEGGLPKQVAGQINPDDLDRINSIRKNIEKFRSNIGTDPGAEPAIIELEGQLAKILGAYKDINREQDILANRGSAEKLVGLYKEYATNAEKARDAIEEAAKSVGLTVGQFKEQNPELVKRIEEKFKEKKTAKDDPTKREIDGQLRFIEAQIAREKDLLQAQEAFLRDTYADGYLSVKDYYDKVSDARAENLQKTLNFYDQEIAAAEKLKSEVTKQTEKQEAQNKIDDIIAKRANLVRDVGNAEAQLDRDRAKSTREYFESLDELNAKVLEVSQNTAAAAGIRFDASNRTLKNLLTATGETGALKQLQFLREQIRIQAELTDASNRYNNAIGDLQLEQSKLNDLRAVGSLGEISYLTQISELNKAHLANVKALADAYAEIAKNSSNPADILKAKQMQQAVEQLSKQTDLLADKFNNILGDAFADNITALVTGAKSLQDAVRDFGKQVNEQIVKTIADEFKAKLFGQGGALSGIGGFLSDLLGKGNIPGIAGPVSKDVADLATKATDQAAQAAAVAALTTAGTSLTVSGTVLDTSGTILATAGTGLLTAATALTAAAAALSAGQIADTASSVAPFISTALAGFAGGTDYAPGGMAIVGESGPELVNLPVGSKVTPTHKMNSMGGAVINIYQTVQPGADTAAFRQKALDAATALQASWRNR